jgi:hypothetical protein
MLHKDYNRKCSVKKNIGRGSQGAWRKDELTGDKPPVVKQLLTLALTLRRKDELTGDKPPVVKQLWLWL